MKEAIKYIKFWACQCSKHTLALGQQIGSQQGSRNVLEFISLSNHRSHQSYHIDCIDSNELPIALGSGSKWGLKLTQSHETSIDGEFEMFEIWVFRT
jgi:hypothetical protein